MTTIIEDRSMCKLLLAICLSSSTAFSASLYIGLSGSDTNNGTRGSPFATLQKGLDLAKPGDRLTLLPGEFTQDAQMRTSGADGAPIVVTGEKATFNGRFRIYSSYLIVSNLAFTGHCIELRRPTAHHNIFKNNLFFDNTGIGIYFMEGEAPYQTNGPSFNLIQGNCFSNAVAYHFLAVVGSHNLIESNRFEQSNGYDAIRMFGLSNTVRANVFVNIGAAETNNNHADIIQTFGSSEDHYSRGIVFERNLILDCSAQLCNMTDDYDAPNITDWTFRNNVVAFSRGQVNCYVAGTKWYNNTFYRCPGPSFLGFRSGEGRGTAHNTEVFNNLIIECGDPMEAPNKGFYAFAPGATNCLGDYNMIAGPGGATKTLTELHGLNGGDPLFMDPRQFDFRLRPGSPAIGRGRLIPTVGDDLGGKSRPLQGRYDIGAVQSAPEGRPDAPRNLRAAQ